MATGTSLVSKFTKANIVNNVVSILSDEVKKGLSRNNLKSKIDENEIGLIINDE